MDQSEYQNMQNLTHLIRSQSLKRITQLLVSVSLFSFLCSYSSFYSFFFHSIKFYLSAFPFQITSKNFIFLIFNGILVFLVKTSGLLHSWSGFDPMEPKYIKKITDGLQIETEKKEEVLVYINSDLEEEEEEETRSRMGGGENLINEERESSNLIVKVEEEEEEESVLFSTGGEGENGNFINEEEEKEIREEEEEIGMLSTEELNKKFDEFIRKMKEEIRIETEQQLIMI